MHPDFILIIQVLLHAGEKVNICNTHAATPGFLQPRFHVQCDYSSVHPAKRFSSILFNTTCSVKNLFKRFTAVEITGKTVWPWKLTNVSEESGHAL